MPGFQYFSSSPPTTPDKRTDGGSKGYFGNTSPSTTPAGPPPPSSAGSYTPAGPPPSSFLGSSTYSSNSQPFDASKQSIFNSPAQFQNSQAGGTSGGLFGRPSRPRSRLSFEFGKSNTDRPIDLAEDDEQHTQEEEYEEDAEGDEYDEEEEREEENDGIAHQYSEEYSDEEDDQMAADETKDYYGGNTQRSPSRFNSSGPLPRPASSHYGGGFSQGSDLLLQSPARFGHTQNRQGNLSDFQKSLKPAKLDHPSEPIYGKIATAFASRLGVAELKEPADIILGTEDTISRLYADGIGAEDDGEKLRRALSTIPSELISLWVDHERTTFVPQSRDHIASIGPGPRAAKFATAQFLASLLLKLHHPTVVKSGHYNPESPSKSLRLYEDSSDPTKLRQLPSMLLDWMHDNHDPSPSLLNDIRQYSPSPSAHPFFWETLLNSLLRGKIYVVALALKDAGWEYSRTANGTGRSEADDEGYSGQVLENIKTVVEEATQILSQCPAVMGDWNVHGSDWKLFRLRVSQALENLKIFAEGSNRHQGDIRGLPAQSLSTTARKAQSQIPWSVYQRLTTLYNLMLGDSLAVMESAQDWCEATVGLVVWWNPSSDLGNLGMSRSQHMQEASPEAYLDRITDAFYIATQGSDFQVNTLSPAEVGLASIFEGDIRAVVALLETCSVPIASAIVEIGSLGGWLPEVESQNLITMGSLDQDDMELLGLSNSTTKTTDLKDDILVGFARELRNKQTFEYVATTGRRVTRDGWELALEVLGRLNSTQRSEQEVNSLIEDFPLNSSSTIDKLWGLLNYLGMSSQAEVVALKYADSLADSTKNYGESLYYYALSHSPKKVKDVLNLLVSYSLIHSTAWPPTSELDPHLATLISAPQAELAKLAKVDFEAAELLHKLLSGYATLRTFYTLRDAEVIPAPEFSHLRPKERKSQAGAALIAVLASSDDNIRGGLYDESRDAVVSVDFLLALLGETMAYISQQSSSLPTSHLYTILKSIEDLQGVQSIQESIYNDCEAFFQTVIASTPGLKGSNPMNLLSKTSSNLSGSGESFSLVGSSMLASQLMKSMSGSNTMTVRQSDLRRGWDWRNGLEVGMTGVDVLKVLRLGLAQELAKSALRDSE